MEHQIRVYNDPEEDLEDDLRAEYNFKDLKARPNPYAARALQRKVEAEKAKEAENLQSSEG